MTHKKNNLSINAIVIILFSLIHYPNISVAQPQPHLHSNTHSNVNKQNQHSTISFEDVSSIIDFERVDALQSVPIADRLGGVAWLDYDNDGDLIFS